jgi:hypothetical protein
LKRRRKKKESVSGLPDGIFSNQKSQFGQILEGLAIKVLVYFMAFRFLFTVI